jgi:exodeoxyribonuclease VII large subunit
LYHGSNLGAFIGMVLEISFWVLTSDERFLTDYHGPNIVPDNRPIQQGLFSFDGKDGGPPAGKSAGKVAQKVYSVSEITGMVKDQLVKEPSLQRLLVVGEVYEVTIPSSGHVYFSLKDTESVLRCVMFKSRTDRLEFKLEPGMKVQAFGSINVYERSGQYQLIVERLQREGLGALFLAFEKLRKKLEAEGLFAEARKRPIPKFPKVVGLVTSPTGAAIQDILRVSKTRWPGARILLAPASVQGEAAPREVIAALALLNKVAAQENINVIIVARGGGSPEDLAAFNDEAMARAIAASSIPVVTGIGHEVDRTIADYVADKYAATPSQAAEIVFPDAHEQLTHVQDLMMILSSRTKGLIRQRREKLQMLKSSRALSRPTELIEELRQVLDDISASLNQALSRSIEHKRHSLALASTALGSLDPKTILGRGYSISLDESGQVIKDPEQLQVGDRFKVLVHKGEIDAKVEKKKRTSSNEN